MKTTPLVALVATRAEREDGFEHLWRPHTPLPGAILGLALSSAVWLGLYRLAAAVLA